mmetsp:Transcript_29434/g.85630  ORF Transcript_29434/g.85630 Transcript_29434/m.85630 type:complete len:411 (+) Transcript_29434:249-1481(+)
MSSALAFVGATAGAVSLPAPCGIAHSFELRRPLALGFLLVVSRPSHAPRSPARIFRRTIIRHASGGEEEEKWPGFARYSWTIPSHVRDSSADVSQIADLMLEFGAASASIVPASPIDVTSDEEFAKTGKISIKGDGSSSSDWCIIEFWIFEYNGEDPPDAVVQAESLVRDVLASLCPDDMISDPGDIHRIIDDGHIIVPDDDLSLDATTDGAQTLRINGVDLSILSSLDNKWAFGDGLHASTTLPIRGLEEFFAGDWASEQPPSLLDYGCGSGILTLVGLALGADNVTSVDISDDALFLTKENLRRNEHIVNYCKTVQVLKSLDDGSGNWEGSFDVVVANIPSNTLTMLVPTLARALKDGTGVVLTSGYPTTELENVAKAANDCGLDEEMARRRYESGWVLQVFGVGRSS